MQEYGLFSDEGCIEAGFHSDTAAEAAIADRYDVDDELTVRAICPDHEEQPADACEECFGEDG